MTNRHLQELQAYALTVSNLRAELAAEQAKCETLKRLLAEARTVLRNTNSSSAFLFEIDAALQTGAAE